MYWRRSVKGVAVAKPSAAALSKVSKPNVDCTWDNWKLSESYAAYMLFSFSDTSILTFHNSELEVLPQTAFRLPRCSEQVLVLDKVMLASRRYGHLNRLSYVSFFTADIVLKPRHKHVKTTLPHELILRSRSAPKKSSSLVWKSH